MKGCDLHCRKGTICNLRSLSIDCFCLPLRRVQVPRRSNICVPWDKSSRRLYFGIDLLYTEIEVKRFVNLAQQSDALFTLKHFEVGSKNSM